MNYFKVIMLLNIFFNSLSFISQKNFEKYNFIVENRIINDLDSLLYKGITFEFSSEREFISDSVFIEKNLLSERDTFKISPFKWEIRINNKWEVFHSSTSFPKTMTKWGSFYLIPISMYYYKGEVIYTYILSADEKNLENDEPLIIHFNSNIGIVKIEYPEFILIRKQIW